MLIMGRYRKIGGPSLTAPPISGSWRLDEDIQNDEGRPISAGLEECVKTMRVGEVCQIT